MRSIKNEDKKEFDQVIQIIVEARSKLVRVVNKELISLYWEIGGVISKNVASGKWGQSIVASLAKYIKDNYPDLKGYSDKNLWRMKQFFEEYNESPEISPLVKQVNWTNNLIVFSRTKDKQEREYYLKKCIEENLSKRELERLFDTDNYTNVTKIFKRQKLSPAVRELRLPIIQEHFKDQYFFDFLDVADQHSEKDLKKGLIKEIGKFLTEMGKDFLFVAEEFRVQVGNTDFFIDLLLFHRELQCLVAVELKTTKFRPEHMGQLNFYLEALDRDVKKENENPSVGLLLCKHKDNEVVEYAMSRNISQSLVAEYKTRLPAIKTLEKHAKQIFNKYENQKGI